MPFVNIKTMKGALTEEQKSELHEKITNVLVEIEGKGNKIFRRFVTVCIEELDPQNWSMGGSQGTEV